MTLTTDSVACHTVDGVTTITLRRPEVLNAQTPELWDRLAEIGRGLTGETRVVVVRGAGRSFSAGLDRSLLLGPTSLLAEMVALTPEAGEARIHRFQDAFRWLRRPDLVSIAAVQGHALGAGLQLALACDLRIFAESAKVGLPEATLGIIPDLGGTKPLVDLVGASRALELCLTGRHLDASEAFRLGLATRVVGDEGLDLAVDEVAEAITRLPAGVAAELKTLLAQAAAHTRDQQEAAERSAQLRCLRRLAGEVE